MIMPSEKVEFLPVVRRLDLTFVALFRAPPSGSNRITILAVECRNGNGKFLPSHSHHGAEGTDRDRHGWLELTWGPIYKWCPQIFQVLDPHLLSFMFGTDFQWRVHETCLKMCLHLLLGPPSPNATLSADIIYVWNIFSPPLNARQTSPGISGMGTIVEGGFFSLQFVTFKKMGCAACS